MLDTNLKSGKVVPASDALAGVVPASGAFAGGVWCCKVHSKELKLGLAICIP